MSQAAGPELAAILTSAAHGDEVAFGRIVGLYHDDLYSVCVLVCRDRPMAEEALGSTWAIAWRKLGSVRQPDRLRPWLVSVAVNECRGLLRKRSRRAEIEVIVEATDRPGGVDPATGVDGMDLRAAIERLDPDDRALLAMRYVAGFNATELSAAVGVSPAGVRTRLRRLTDRLRQELTDG